MCIHSSLAGTTQKLHALVTRDRRESNTCNHSARAKSFYYLCCSVHVLILKTFPNYCKAERSNLSCQLWVDASNLLNNLTLIMFLTDRYQELNCENNIQTSTGCQKCQSPSNHHFSSVTFVAWLSTSENEIIVQIQAILFTGFHSLKCCRLINLDNK